MEHFGSRLGIKSPKRSVLIENYRGRIRLRLRYQGKKYSLSLSFYNKLNLLQAGKTALQIEQDMVTGAFAPSLVRYSGKKAQPPSYTNYLVLLEYRQLHTFEKCNVVSDIMALQGMPLRY